VYLLKKYKKMGCVEGSGVPVLYIGRRFLKVNTIEEIQAETQRVLDTATENDFLEEFQKWR
jgi:hypothetical protein